MRCLQGPSFARAMLAWAKDGALFIWTTTV